MIDETDLRILGRVQRDGAESLEELGAAVGLSRNACWRRVKRLADDGVIRRRVALLDAESLNCPLTVFIWVRTSDHEIGWLERFHAAVRDIPEIVGVFRTTGDVDYVLHAMVPDVPAYDRLYKRLIARVPLTDVSSSFVMERIKDTTELPLGYAGRSR
ncbi:MAG: Lrp/AsnC family transcriptional regulator [Flavobacteriaceae bacterium]